MILSGARPEQRHDIWGRNGTETFYVWQEWDRHMIAGIGVGQKYEEWGKTRTETLYLGYD